MILNNILQYSKIGIGAVLTVGGISSDLGVANSRQAAEEAIYRALEVVNPETILKAQQEFNSYRIENSAMEVPFTNVLMIGIGAGILASGIYNLVKNYKKETANLSDRLE